MNHLESSRILEIGNWKMTKPNFTTYYCNKCNSHITEISKCNDCYINNIKYKYVKVLHKDMEFKIKSAKSIRNYALLNNNKKGLHKTLLIMSKVILEKHLSEDKINDSVRNEIKIMIEKIYK